MCNKKNILCAGVFFTAILFYSLIYSQTVEKLSAPFTFPLTLTSVPRGVINAMPVSFFHVMPKAQKGKILLQWTVSNNAKSGVINIYSLSGALVKRVNLKSNHGAILCDINKAGAGIYVASISYGSYHFNQKFALYR